MIDNRIKRSLVENKSTKVLDRVHRPIMGAGSEGRPISLWLRVGGNAYAGYKALFGRLDVSPICSVVSLYDSSYLSVGTMRVCSTQGAVGQSCQWTLLP